MYVAIGDRNSDVIETCSAISNISFVAHVLAYGVTIRNGVS